VPQQPEAAELGAAVLEPLEHFEPLLESRAQPASLPRERPLRAAPQAVAL